MLISEIYDEIIAEVGGDTSDTDLQDLMLTCMKGALRILPAKARDRTLIGIETITLLASAQSASLPSGFIHEVSDESIWRTEDNKRIVIFRYQRDDFNQVYSSGIIGTPKYYRIYAKTIEFDRKAETDLTIYIECFKEVSSIVASDTFFGNDTVIAALKALTKHTYFDNYEEDESRGATQSRIAQDLLDELDAKYMEEELGTHVVES